MKRNTLLFISTLLFAAVCVTGCKKNNHTQTAEFITKSEDNQHKDIFTRDTTVISDSNDKSGNQNDSGDNEIISFEDIPTMSGNDNSESSTENTSNTDSQSNENTNINPDTKIWPEVPLHIDNKLGCKIYELYICEDPAYYWGTNLIKETLDDSNSIDIPIKYSTNHHIIDIKAVDVSGQELTFSGIDLLNASDPEAITIELTINNNSYSATVN